MLQHNLARTGRKCDHQPKKKTKTKNGGLIRKVRFGEREQVRGRKKDLETGNKSEEMSAKGKEIKNTVKGSCHMTER